MVRRRLQVIRTGDVAGIMEDYTEDSTIYTPDGPIKGLETIRSLFDAFFAGAFAEVQSLEVLRQDCDGEFAHLFWKAETAAVNISLRHRHLHHPRRQNRRPERRRAHYPQGLSERGFISCPKSAMSDLYRI